MGSFYIVGAAYIRENASILSFGNEGGFKPEQGSHWVPFLSHGFAHKLVPVKQKRGWRNPPPQVIDNPEEHFAAVKPESHVAESAELQDSNHVPQLGDSAWEDDGTL